MSSEIYIILHNIRGTHNVGSIFRTADAAGIKKIYLTGYTPAPLDRFKREVKSITKVSLGAEKSILWEKIDIASLVERLRKEDFKIIALEQSSTSVDYRSVKLNGKTAIILGNEVDGIEKELLDKCDIVAEIPMSGKKESLNVSVAAGIFLFRLLSL